MDDNYANGAWLAISLSECIYPACVTGGVCACVCVAAIHITECVSSAVVCFVLAAGVLVLPDNVFNHLSCQHG